MVFKIEKLLKKINSLQTTEVSHKLTNSFVTISNNKEELVILLPDNQEKLGIFVCLSVFFLFFFFCVAPSLGCVKFPVGKTRVI